MQVAGGLDEHAGPVHDPLVLLLAPAVRVAGLVRVGVAPVPARPLPDVEDRVEAPALHVHPDRPHVPDPARRGRALRHEVHLVDHVDLRRRRPQVVDHVVEEQRVRGLDRVAVALRQANDGLLLAGREERLDPEARRAPRHVHPDAVVEVDHVHARHAAVQVGQVGPDAGEPAVDLRPLDDRRVADLILAGNDVEGTDPVRDALRTPGKLLHRRGLPDRRARVRAGGDHCSQREAGGERASGAPDQVLHERHRIYLRPYCDYRGAAAAVARSAS